MKRDAFSGVHPAVNFIFFIGALGFGMVLQHPAFLLAGLLAAGSYYALLKGPAGAKGMLAVVPLMVLVTALNPLINRSGATVLFQVFGIPYTLEALAYGAVLSGMFLNMLLWFGCCSVVLTGDKFTSLFGSLIPSLSLLLVMIFRMVPGLTRKGRQITDCRRSIGKGIREDGSYAQKLKGGLTVLGCLTTWALEGSIVTADSMRSRGYGTARRTSFLIHRMTTRDWGLLAALLALAAAVIWAMAEGGTTATFTPEWYIAPIELPGLLAYAVFTLIPTVLHLQEALIWHISRSRI